MRKIEFAKSLSVCWFRYAKTVGISNLYFGRNKLKFISIQAFGGCIHCGS